MIQQPVALRPPRGAGRDLSRESDARGVLRLLRVRDSASWAELEQSSRIAPSRFSAAVARLENRGLIESLRPGNSRAGLRSRQLRVNPKYGNVIGMDIGGTNLRIVLADMMGAVLAKWSASTRKTSSPDMLIQQIRRGVDSLLQAGAVPRSSLLAVAAGAPGVTDADAGVVLATSYLGGWRDVPLRDLLQSALRIPAAIENDVRLGAIGEHWRGAARGVRDFAFLAIGTGIAAGIFVNGGLVHGADRTAGEVGYMLVPGVSAKPVHRGSPGPLESLIGGEGIKLQWLRSRNGRHNLVRRRVTATEIFDYARGGDRIAKEILDRSARMLAYAVYNISVVLNCSLFVLGGGVGLSEPLRDATERILAEYDEPARPKLALSRLGQDAQLIGTIRLALETADSHAALGQPGTGTGSSLRNSRSAAK